MNSKQKPINSFPPAGLFRRLAAMVYDGFILLAILFFATLLLLPLTGGEAIPALNPAFQTYLFMISFGFYAWFWTHGGQTVGMRAWKLRVQQKNGAPITLWQALLRFLIAIPSLALLGAGYLWVVVDKDKMAWHDRYSETIIVRTG